CCYVRKRRAAPPGPYCFLRSLCSRTTHLERERYEHGTLRQTAHLNSWGRVTDSFFVTSISAEWVGNPGLMTSIRCLPSARLRRFSGGLTPLLTPSTKISPHRLTAMRTAPTRAAPATARAH